MATNKPKRLKPSRPMAEIPVHLHTDLKAAADAAGFSLKDYTAALLSNGLLRVKAGELKIEKYTIAESPAT